MFEWLRRLLKVSGHGAPAVPWEERDGHPLRWRDRRVSVYLDASLFDGQSGIQPFAVALSVVRRLRAAGVSILLLPVPPDAPMVVEFATSRQTMHSVVMIRAVLVHPAPDQPYKCHQDWSFDKRDGEIRSVQVDWDMIGDEDQDAATLAHELGHALGLAHQDGTAMAGNRKRGGPAWFSDAQIAELRRVYPE